MLQDSLQLQQRYLKFVKTVSRQNIVYALENKKGYATSTSTLYEDNDGNPLGLICMWAEKARAKSCVAAAWSSYKLSSIPLAEFLESWCIGMAQDNLYMGIAFDSNMYGYEADPFEVLLDVAKEVKSQGRILKLRNFKNIDELIHEIETIMR